MPPRNQSDSEKEAIKAELKQLGQAIKRVRSNAGMTQEKLAELTNLNTRTVQKIEAGQTNILITTTTRIKKALGCKWEDLLG